MSSTGPARSRSIQPSIGFASDVGRIRPENEDRFYVPLQNLRAPGIQNKGYLCIVADGMGGHDKGEVASEMAARRVAEEYYADPNPDPESSLRRAIQTANAEIFTAAQQTDLARMGTTLVAAVSMGNQVIVANVGDSRAYLISQGRAFQITRDHSWVQDRVDEGVLTEEQARQHAQRSLITRALGTHATVDVDIYRPAADPGDWVLLCSDGLSTVVRPEEMGRTVSQLPAQAATNQLVAQANARGGPDNITVVVLPAIASAGGMTSAYPQARVPMLPALAAFVVAGIMLVFLVLLWTRAQEHPPALASATLKGRIHYAVKSSQPADALAEYFVDDPNGWQKFLWRHRDQPNTVVSPSCLFLSPSDYGVNCLQPGELVVEWTELSPQPSSFTDNAKGSSLWLVGAANKDGWQGIAGTRELFNRVPENSFVLVRIKEEKGSLAVSPLQITSDQSETPFFGWDGESYVELK